MLVREIMTPTAESLAAGMCLRDAAAKMREMAVDCLPVRSAGRLVGFVTDRDIAYRGVADGNDPGTTLVEAVMTQAIPWCFDDQDTAEAAHVMEERHVRRLLVLDHADHAVGLVALGDLLRLAGAHLSAAATIEAFDEYYGWSAHA